MVNINFLPSRHWSIKEKYNKFKFLFLLATASASMIILTFDLTFQYKIENLKNELNSLQLIKKQQKKESLRLIKGNIQSFNEIYLYRLLNALNDQHNKICLKKITLKRGMMTVTATHQNLSSLLVDINKLKSEKTFQIDHLKILKNREKLLFTLRLKFNSMDGVRDL